GSYTAPDAHLADHRHWRVQSHARQTSVRCVWSVQTIVECPIFWLCIPDNAKSGYPGWTCDRLDLPRHRQSRPILFHWQKLESGKARHRLKSCHHVQSQKIAQFHFLSVRVSDKPECLQPRVGEVNSSDRRHPEYWQYALLHNVNRSSWCLHRRG